MAVEAQLQVVILYEHALLGEGIARVVLAQAGVEAKIAHAQDDQAVASALATDPAVIIFELHDPLQLGDLAMLAPHAVLIDVSTAVARGPSLPCATGFGQILQTVCSICCIP